MAGHNKWSKVKRLKGALDQKRGKLFSKLAKEITVAAKMGGGDPSGNARLRSAVLAARAQSMPSENIDRAIKRGTGEGEVAANYEEHLYEGYAPGGVALLLEVTTDNKNRAAADLRLIFSKNGGNLASSGSVAYLFQKKGQISVPRSAIDEDRMLEIALECGAEELTGDEGHHILTTAPDRLYAVAEALKTAGLSADSQKLTYVAASSVEVTDEAIAAQVLRLIDALEDNDDVQQVHANFDVPDSILARITV
jgi:YebC/PmpR family DNA-binding regulatory protein